MAVTTSRLRRLLVSGAVVVGAGLGAAGIASAASSTTTSTPAPAAGTLDLRGMDPATMTHGPGETLLTGTDATEATAAATAAVSGSSVVRAETDSAGAAYEVHLKKADGAYVTVKEDASFKVTSVEDGFGARPAGAAPAPMPPSDASR